MRVLSLFSGGGLEIMGLSLLGKQIMEFEALSPKEKESK
jgi:hypothetical protein